ncbi:MAG: alpha,alpha-trehalase TreA [Chitinophagaceae bacterium]|nr:alpha,alpha-trehalase TreA [Chitinophagaceae bacterium]
MKRHLLLALLAASCLQIIAQTPTPDKLWGQLFKDVQLKRVFADNKTFVDCTPKYGPANILGKYAKQKNQPDFDLKDFITVNFNMPVSPIVHVTEGLPLREHLEQLWDALTHKADTPHKYSSLLPLPYPYIIPGGRFREIYYWDSYFTMQGLAVSNHYDLIANMVDNFKSLIDSYGHIPNGNRNYYLGRSQQPYFAKMVEMLQQHDGDKAYKKYFSSMEKEYKFWMQGAGRLKTVNVYRRLVRMPDGSLLNRHWDDVNAPRQESYAEDVATNKSYTGKDGKAYVNLRASAESGWDFCSRWFRDTMHINTIETTDMVPVDLNALLYAYEIILAKAATANDQPAKATMYNKQAQKRKTAVLKYCWNDDLHYFFDYDIIEKHTSDRWSIAAAMPLFTQLADSSRAADVARLIEEKFAKDGGVVTTIYHTGEQWDAPNGWAPLQFLAVKGLLNYHYDTLAKDMAERWMSLNEKVFKSTGKMLEKYNVEDLNIISGGGEYPTQDGFGWTNGVYLAFYNLFRK